ncbi:adenylate/guanylate cyclase domain-containing protein [Treponema phagedenis]|uniref:Adenylate/guanylate cyclase domain-containing protein n=1 Tax=Treponema phagedenis TaxID=162 RepID=A0AAE6IT20_TREPH|nr:adenylate/guanylate cyclase domain-containing protein [Treponema phagedenis]EFW37110.1 hypothetical protein HMPREF9554_02418 [Treponema phagedenis F0421]NVP24434.1 adenylate/guanylate cyclase domain-containing protein [Treponema phagedenis]QEJ95454.1 adenylate/guanylate cyclase domain-containing protein [Treponema phagedenis]QEJ97804.1 adenylate/guanylate cyclase domain-containing protein [Treponema phagedenis]QEK01308.1 adenylate/guanylate cyclase domain-containing protein [Treponema phage
MDSKEFNLLGLNLKEDGSVELDPTTLEGLKKMPIDIFDNVYLGEVKPDALILCIDIRGFSNFLCSHDEQTVFSLITSFTSNFLSCVNQFGYGCSYYKLLGDGALVIWDQTNEDSVAEALSVFTSYLHFAKEELFPPYPELGLAGALVQDLIYKYEISAETSLLKYRDYVGYGINLACRVQGLAEKDQLVVNKILADQNYFQTRISKDPALIKDLSRLKGLREEDRNAMYFYV